jgi:predicted RNA-binding Zn-ribbon protein involved in translation (DUF1610 family)
MKQPIKSNNNKDVVTIGNEWTGEDRPTYYCDNCHCTLVRLSDSNNQNESYYCNRCSIDYPDTTNIRQQLKVTVPDRNTETLVSTTPGQDYLNKSVQIRKEQEIKGGLKALQQKGIKITNYKEGIPK